MTDQAQTGAFREGLNRWAARLERVSAGPLRGVPAGDEPAVDSFIATFADDHGHRRPVDRPFLCALFGRAPPTPAETAPVDVILWALGATSEDPPIPELGDSGPLTAQPSDGPLEVWTESDLSALHALWRLARRLGSPELRERALACAAWHVAETQPDNATNHPWAIHVFVVLGAMRHDAPALHYAEGQLHACQLMLGRADLLSALILRDASVELRMLADRAH